MVALAVEVKAFTPFAFYANFQKILNTALVIKVVIEKHCICSIKLIPPGQYLLSRWQATFYLLSKELTPPRAISKFPYHLDNKICPEKKTPQTNNLK